jgi:predicted transcriptional regulator
MKRKNAKRVQMQIRLDPQLRRRLEEEAARRMLSKSLLAERAIAWALDKWESDELVTSNS